MGQLRVYQVTLLRTYGVHCPGSTGTGPIVLEVVPVTGAFFLNNTMYQLMCTYICICVYTVLTQNILWIKRGRLLVLLVVNSTWKISFPCPRSCISILSRQTCSVVPSSVCLLIFHTKAEWICAIQAVSEAYYRSICIFYFTSEAFVYRQ